MVIVRVIETILLVSEELCEKIVNVCCCVMTRSGRGMVGVCWMYLYGSEDVALVVR